MDFKKATITILLLAVSSFFIQYAQAEEMYEPVEKVASESVQNDFADYMNDVQTKLQTAWQPPDFMEEGHVRVHFNLNRQGQVMRVAVIESSGNDIYDESALEAIKNCNPFDAFPETTSREYISIKYSFDTILIEEERMHGYYELAKANVYRNPQMALEYMNMALAKVGGEEASCFLYKRRAEIKERLGDEEGAKEDYDTYNLYINRSNIKRVHLLKHLSEIKPSAYIYHYLAYAYEQVGDYQNAIIAIDKAIELTDDNGHLKRYRNSLIRNVEDVSDKVE